MTNTNRTRLRTIAAAATAALTAAAVLAVPAPAFAVAGGTPTDTTAQPYLATIAVGGTSGQAACTGALITPEWLITSSTCFATDPTQPGTPELGPPHTNTTATVGGQTHTVDTIVPRGDRDLALAHLASPISGVSTVNATTTTPTTGQTVHASGFGRTADEWVPGRAHIAEFTVDAVGATELSLTGTADGPSLCQGDAGGPLLQEGRLVGVASRSYQAGCLGETTEQRGALATRVDDVTDWMVSQVIDLQATPATKNAINLTWTAQDPSLSYRVYGAQADTVALDPDNLLAETSDNHITHGQLPSGQDWSYRVAVIDTDGQAVATSFTAHATSPTATSTDFDGDHADDIAAFDGSTITVALSDNTSRFGTASAWSTQYPSNGASPFAGDVNGDGRDDIVTFTGSQVHVALSTGSSFGPRQQWHDRFSANGQWNDVGDVNGDGLDDIITFTGGSNADVYVALSTGTGFGPVQLWMGSFASGDRVPALGDFNGDGKADAASFGSNGDVWVTLSTGTRFNTSDTRWHTNFTITGPAAPSVGDFDNDGRDDIIAFNRGSNGNVTVARALSTGNTFSTTQTWNNRFCRSTNDEWCGVGDFNRDGKSDTILFTRGTNANVWVSLSTGTEFQTNTQWHDNFAAGTATPIPIWQR